MKAEDLKNKQRKKEKESKLSKGTTALKEATHMIFTASSPSHALNIKSYSRGAFIRQARHRIQKLVSNPAFSL